MLKMRTEKRSVMTSFLVLDFVHCEFMDLDLEWA